MSKSSFGTIRKLPSGRFQARYMLNGTRINAPVTFPTKTMAKAWLATEQTRIVKGEITGATSNTQKPDKTLRQYATEWLSTLEQQGRSPDTIRAYLSKWNKHLAEPFGDYRPDEVTRKQIIDWDRSKFWATATLRRNTLLIFSSFYTWLVDQEIVDIHPVKNLRIGKTDKAKRQKILPTPEQVDQIMEMLPPPMRPAVDLAAWCGLRFGEIAGLERRDIDLTNRLVHVRRATHRGIGGEETVGDLKTAGSYRTITIPPRTFKRLQKHMQENVGAAETALIVHRLGNPNKRLSNKHLHSYFNPAVAQVGLPGMRFHDLRHFALTMFARAGATVAELKNRAGHLSTEVAMLYQQATLERDRLIADRLQS